MHFGCKTVGLLALALAGTLSRTAAAAVVYQNTTTVVGGFEFNGAVAVGTNLAGNIDLDQLILAAGSAGDSITSLSFLADNANTVAVQTRPTMYVWAADAAGGGPGTLLGTFPLAVQTLPAGNSTITLTVPGALTVPSNGVIWAGIGFDNANGASPITADQLNALGGLTYHPATVGTDGPNGFFIAAGSAKTNPSTFAFGTVNGANYGWTVTANAAAPQTITFGPLSNVTLGAAPFTLTATASSGLPVSFASTTSVVCTVSGSVVTIVATGLCSITASQAGNAVYAAAPAVTRSFTVLAAKSPIQIPGGGGAAQVTLPGGTVATPYSQTLQATNGNAPYSWSVLGGALPKGLSLSSSGTVSGTPAQPGTFQFTGKVTDTSGATASSLFAVTIAPQSLTITTPSPLPTGIVGSDYPAQIIAATGGNAPYTFQLTGTLPDGLKFSGGRISGIPTTAGAFSFTVTATDSNSPPLTASAPFQITIQTAHTDLILSQASVAFSLSTGASGLPPGANVSVRSSTATQPLNFSVSMNPVVPWLDITGGGSTPGVIGINLDPKALSLGTGVSNTAVVVTCVAPGPCAGTSQNISVSLTVTAPPPQLSVDRSLLSFSVQAAGSPAVSQSLGLQNAGGGTITVNSITAADSFVTISGTPAAIAAGPASFVTVTASPSGKTPGFYQSSILVSTSAGSVNIPVTLFIAANPAMTLNPAGTQFLQAFGSTPGNPNGSFLVSVSGSGTVNWNATLLPGASWLTLNTASGTSTSASPGAINFSVNPTAAALTAQAYYGAIQVTSNDVVDSPQTFIVILNVAPAGTPAQPIPTPAGLLFLSSAGGAPAPQTVQVFTSSATPVTFQASSDSSWLVVSPTAGPTSTASAGSTTVSVNLSGLAPGVYRGNVSYALSSAAVRTVNVTLIVESGTGASARTGPSPKAACAPAQLVPTQTGLVNNFAQPAAWPTPLSVKLVNDCGQPVSNGQVVATFSNGDPPLVLGPTDTASGIYSATWTPRNTSGQTSISARATAAGFPAATVQILGQVTPNNAPLLSPNGTLNAFAIAAEPGVPIAPGTIVQIYGSNLTAQTTLGSTIPLATTLDQTSVIIGGLPAPLYYVSPGQINAQVPFELSAGNTYQVIVNANGALSTPNPIQLTSDSPGIAQYAAGQVIAQHVTDNSLITETSPAKPGEYVVFYLAGLGLTNPNVASGTASPSGTLATPLDAATLTLNGSPVPAASVLFAGLTPTLVGLYQVDFQVPANAPNGDLPLVLTQSSGLSKSTILPVHN